ncbi:OprO/OprP family phosphate-selective porin [Adhaeretor mobilis]|uniref:Porin P n=1 Tax=Adhaeretor mobilis TaxID=1930276 RepID=A0A517MPF8_9BACT|nr:porin [Adhaeretor mobilis]QDS96776.1 Porin P precursor [Adhaeretor mobilis]
MKPSDYSTQASLWRQRRRIIAAVVLGMIAQLLLVATLSASDSAAIQPLPPLDSEPLAPVAHYHFYLEDEPSLKLADTNGEDTSDAAEDGVGGNELSDIKKRLKKLEDNYDELEEDYGNLEEDHSELSDSYNELKGKLKNVAFSGHEHASMKVGGRIHADMWSFPGDSAGVNMIENEDPTISPQDRVGFRRMRFGVKGKLMANMLYKIEMEFAGGNKSEFRDAYLGWNDVPFLQTVLLGNQKRPYGLDHLNSSRYNVFMERPFVIESFNQDARRWGLASYCVSQDEAWNWRYGVFNQRLIQDEGSYVSDHYQMEGAGRLANTWWYDETSGGRGYGHWAVSGTLADPDGSGIAGRAANEARFRHRPEARSSNRWIDTGQITGADDYQMVGLENVWNFGALQLVGEYQNMWVQRREANETHLHGGYAYLSYFLTGEHMPWDRSSGTLGRVKPLENFFLVDTCADGIRGGWGAWQLAYRYSYADFNDNDIAGGIGNSHTLGLNWYWSPYARMQFNAIYGEIDDRNVLEEADDPTSSLGVFSGHYTILGARFMVDF